MQLSKWGRAGLWVLLATVCLSASAQDDKRAAREREALRRAQQQVQRATQENTALQEKLGAAEQERAKLGAEVEAVQQQARSEAARGQRLSRELKALGTERDQLAADKQALEAQLKTATERAARLERELAQVTARAQSLDTRNAALDKSLAACGTRSEGLYATGRALIDDCRTHQADKPALSLEAFTGLRRVGLENMLQGYRDKLDQDKP